jgi:hypothetical protein
MALISRYMLQVTEPAFVDQAPQLFRDWVAGKRSDTGLDLPADGDVVEFDGGSDLRANRGAEGDLAAFRGAYFQQRSDEQVRTTFTALAAGDSRWAWVDLERWSDDPFSPDWVPLTPRLLDAVFEFSDCFRGPTTLTVDYLEVEGSAGAKIAAAILDPDREVPYVVTTPTRQELGTDLGPARRRALELQRRLRGIAPVVLLGTGAVESFSRAMIAVAPRLDVFNGAIRTYLPRVGGDQDWPRRHRLIPYHLLSDRPDDRIARLVGMPVLRAACQALPPPAWADARDLVGMSALARPDADLERLLELAEGEKAAAEEARETAVEARGTAEDHLEAVRHSEAEALAEYETTRRRLDFAQRQIRELGRAPDEPSEPPAQPDFCSDALTLCEERCPDLVVGPAVAEGTDELDVHVQQAWAIKAWRAFRAMQAYAEAKREGSSPGGFFEFCERSGHPNVIPSTWIASSESETTNQNQDLRRLRTFEVPTAVSSEGSVYMPAHIKIEQGGYPAPRIHFHDDTDGATEKVHLGWFGPHHDSKAKN